VDIVNLSLVYFCLFTTGALILSNTILKPFTGQ